MSLSYKTSVGIENSSESRDVLILFNSYGLLLKNVDDEFTVPEDWKVLSTSARSWYVESVDIQPKYLFPTDIPPGTYRLINGSFESESGETFTKTRLGIVKVVEKGKSEKKLRVSEKAEAVFQIPGAYRIYYTLKEDILEQFFEVFAPIDSAFVIVSNAPEESRNQYYRHDVLYAPTLQMDDSEREEFEVFESTGRKLFALGELNGLNKRLNVKNKTMKVERRDVNIVELSYKYTYDWQPADYVVELKTEEELVAGDLYVYGDAFGHLIPIKRTWMEDVKKESEIAISKSWQVYHSWELKKLTEIDKRVYVSGDMKLRGKGLVKIRVDYKELNNLIVVGGAITKKALDFAEIELEIDGETAVHIEYDYKK